MQKPSLCLKSKLILKHSILKSNLNSILCESTRFECHAQNSISKKAKEENSILSNIMMMHKISEHNVELNSNVRKEGKKHVFLKQSILNDPNPDDLSKNTLHFNYRNVITLCPCTVLTFVCR